MNRLHNKKIAVLLHEGVKGVHGKTGLALLRYSDEDIVAVIDAESAGESIKDLPQLTRDVPIVASVREALVYNPDVLLIGIAPSGGMLPDHWYEEIKSGLVAGLSLVNGLHVAMSNDSNLTRYLKSDQWIWDIRVEPKRLSVGSGLARSLDCRRVLAVGTDMAIGKMSSSIELDRATRKLGLRSKFIATGQAGIMIAGDGIALDAVRVDFAAGAVEQIVMKYGSDYDYLYIEGQGSLLHPGSTATLPLMRGCQPTDLILVHRAQATTIRKIPSIGIPPLTEVISLYNQVARVGGGDDSVGVVGICLNTFHLDDHDARVAIAKAEDYTNLPCTDPIRYGVDKLLGVIVP